MGRQYFSHLREHEHARVVAVCDRDAERRAGKWADPAGNISAGDRDRVDMAGIDAYGDWDALIDDERVDVVAVTLPTPTHADVTVRALEAGKHVLCEKPMAMSYAECLEMLAVAEEVSGKLMVAQCVRFFPAYEFLYETVESGRLGRLLQLSLWRGSTPPPWSWQNWLLDHKRSGGMILDLHVHDADFVQHLLGRPRAVCSTGAIGPSGGYDVVDTQYIYGDKMAVRASGNVTLETIAGIADTGVDFVSVGSVTHSAPALDIHLVIE